jgi:hypothetical protein
MSLLKSMSVVLAAGAVTAGSQVAFARPDARSLREVDRVWVDSNSCSADISDQLESRGFFVTNNRRAADAILVVDVDSRTSRRLDSTADYSARLHGEDDYVIFTASGTRNAYTHSELCEEIGDSIADSMDRMG